MKKLIKRIIIVCIFLSILFISNTVFAETRISSSIEQDFVWIKSADPYILDSDIDVSENVKLTVEPGTEINLNGHELSVFGSIHTNGSVGEKVKIYSNGSGQISIENNHATSSFIFTDIENVRLITSFGGGTIYDNVSFVKTGIAQSKGFLDIRRSSFFGGARGISIRNATATLDHVSLKDIQNNAIYIFKSTLRGSYLEVENSKSGILIQDKGPVLVFLNKIFKPVTVLADGDYSVKISSSTIASNQNFNVSNDTESTVDARNNWWGSDTGPGGTTIGNVLFSPWLLTKPQEEVLPEIICCSNILFLPGLQSSRLFSNGLLGTENQLWEPNRNKDAQKLYLNKEGKSITKNVYAKEIISETNILPVAKIPIYKSFISNMDALVASGTIKQWQSLPYDWRLSLEDVYIKSDIGNVVSGLASTSLSGKVTVISHSNGGLLAKYVLAQLEKSQKEHLIDKVLFVAVPHFGTPKAIASLLYGEDQAIAGGVIMSKTTAKGLSENMPSAFNLLPSQKYFNGSNNNVITTPTTTVDSVLKLNSFLSPQNQSLLSSANTVHSWLDNWQPPNGIGTYQIIGDNLSTLLGLSYVKLANGSLDHQPITTKRGDGTVVYHSALADFASTTKMVDMRKESADLKKNVTHAAILEIPSVNTCIASFISNGLCPKLAQASTLPTIPSINLQRSMINGVHSPVDIGMTDKDGNYTGRIYPETDSDFDFYREDIPGSKYMEIGEGKYVVVDDMKTIESISIKGTGFGTFSYTLATSTDSGVALSFEFQDIPVTPDTIATISPDKPHLMNIDFDGNGSIDATTSDSTAFDPLLYISSMKFFVEKLSVSKPVKDLLIRRLDKISKKIEKNNTPAVRRTVYKLVRNINFKKHGFKKISKEDMAALHDLFIRFADGLEKIQ